MSTSGDVQHIGVFNKSKVYINLLFHMNNVYLRDPSDVLMTPPHES